MSKLNPVALSDLYNSSPGIIVNQHKRKAKNPKKQLCYPDSVFCTDGLHRVPLDEDTDGRQSRPFSVSIFHCGSSTCIKVGGEDQGNET